jgi:predicted PurR-regulated permease PerM
MHSPETGIDRPPFTPQDLVTVIVALLFLSVLTYLIAPLLSPFVAAGAVLFLLYPLRAHPLPRRLLWLTVGLFLFWFVSSILGLLAPFIVAFLIAYLLNPLVSAMERRRVPRWTSSLLAVLLLIGLVVAAVLFILPPLVQQFNTMLSGLGDLARELSAVLQSGTLFSILERAGIPMERARAMIAEQLSPRVEGVLSMLLGGVFNVVTGVSSLALHVINAVIVPFLVFYLLLDYPAITRRFLGFVPAAGRDRFAARLGRVDGVLGRYIRGAIVVALIQGTISTLVLWFIGVRYPLVLGIMTAILNFIPYLGLLTTMLVASIVAVLSGEPALARVAGVVVLYFSQKLLEATVLGPKIIGAQVGLHPVLLILCLLVFGYFLGFIGLLIAVPATALLVVGLNEWQERRANDLPVPAEE